MLRSARATFLPQRSLPGPFLAPGRSLLAGPIWCSVPFQVIPERLVRAELVKLLYDDRWNDVLYLCRRLRFSGIVRAGRIRRGPSTAGRHSPPRRMGRSSRMCMLGESGELAEGVPGSAARGPQAAAAQPSKHGLNVLSDLQAGACRRAVRRSQPDHSRRRGPSNWSDCSPTARIGTCSSRSRRWWSRRCRSRPSGGGR